MPATVKRVAKRRSNKKALRPKTRGATAKRTIVAENVEPMPVVVSAPAVAASAPLASPLAKGKVVLGASCTIHEAPALRSHLLAQAAHPGPYELDGSGVQQIDTAGLQLVVAFALDCLEKGVHYVWTGRSPALEEAIRTLGVGALLESPGAATNYSSPGAA
jgi:anti-anti-sigma regulatory factor